MKTFPITRDQRNHHRITYQKEVCQFGRKRVQHQSITYQKEIYQPDFSIGKERMAIMLHIKALLRNDPSQLRVHPPP